MPVEERYPIECPKCGHKGQEIWQPDKTGIMHLVGKTGGFDKVLVPTACPNCGEVLHNA
jgi:predicted RNA-binding Zn-ribbon protein involved in translation (DUF1610 family)